MTDFLWVIDPWNTLDHPRDTTLRLAEEAVALGHTNSLCDVKSIRFEKGKVLMDVREVQAIYPGRSERSFKLGDVKIQSPSDFENIQYRVDPPVDQAYLHPLQLLVLGSSKTTKIFSPPSILFGSSEKLEASFLGDLMAPTLCSSQWAQLKNFGQSEGRTVLKPMHEAQSKGVELLDWRTPEGIEKSQELLAAATQNWTTPVIQQRYLEKIMDGEQRLFFVDGKLLAHIRKLPLEGDFRVNLDRGSKLAQNELTSAEKKAAAKIGKHLNARKIRFAAVDLIDALVTDLNFTSPGMVPQAEAVLGVNLARPIIEALAKN